MSYQTFVVKRITNLVGQAAKNQRDTEDVLPKVRGQYAVPELAALVATGGAFLVSLLL